MRSILVMIVAFAALYRPAMADGAVRYDVWALQTEGVTSYLFSNRTSNAMIVLRKFDEELLYVAPDLVPAAAQFIRDGYPQATFIAFDLDGDMEFISHDPLLDRVYKVRMEKEGTEINLVSAFRIVGLSVPAGLELTRKITIALDRQFGPPPTPYGDDDDAQPGDRPTAEEELTLEQRIRARLAEETPVAEKEPDPLSPGPGELSLNFIRIDADYPLAGRNGRFNLDVIETPVAPDFGGTTVDIDRNLTADEVPIITLYTNKDRPTGQVTSRLVRIEGLAVDDTATMLGRLTGVSKSQAATLLP